MAKKIMRLTESDLVRLVRKVVNEQSENPNAGNDAKVQNLIDAGYCNA